MHISSLTEEGIEQLVSCLNSQLNNKEFTIVYIQKSNGTFDVYENNANFTARVDSPNCESPNFVEIRYFAKNGAPAAFEIHMTTEILITPQTVQITTKPGCANGLRNIILHL
jgi:hypothetical protein